MNNLSNYDRSNAPTTILVQREHHRIATLGQNRIIRDHYRTQFLNGNERVTRLLPRKRTWRQVMVNLITEKTKRLRRLLSAALRYVRESI
jgi:hypothetical protein